MVETGKEQDVLARESGSRSTEPGQVEIGELYAIERAARDGTREARRQARLAQSQPVLEKLRDWLEASIPTVPPQTLTGKAMHYLDRQWPKRIRFLDDGGIPLDTDLVENAIRPFVVGRKNWLFADRPVHGRVRGSTC